MEVKNCKIKKCFASSVSFTHDLAHLKTFSLASPETGVNILVKANASIA